MYNQNSLATGAKWFFLLAIVVLLGAVALGANLKDAKWLNREIASETAHEMNVQTEIERQKAELDMQLLKTETEIQIAQMKQNAEYEAAKQQQALNAATVAATQKANFQAGLYDTINFGLLVVMIAVGVALNIVGIYAGTGLHKFLSAKAPAIQPSQPKTVIVYKRQPSPAAQRARQREREEREKQIIDNRVNQLFPDSEPIWTAKGDKSEDLKPKNYPWTV